MQIKKLKGGLIMSNTSKIKTPSVFSPLNEKAVSLASVPDPVFSNKVLGDGCAVIPDGGKLYSPVNGEVSSVAETKHAYGFTSKDGLGVLVHFGLETVELKGEGFTPHVFEGDKVKVGDLIAEIDIDLIKEKGLNTITHVLVSDGADDLEMTVKEGAIKTGAPLLTFANTKEEVAAPENPRFTKPPKEKKKHKFNFDFLQKLDKVLMTVIAVMPAAGLMISIGKLIVMVGADVSFVVTIGGVMENIGWAVINNLHILFAAAIGGAFAAIIAFILINNITDAIFGVTDVLLNRARSVPYGRYRAVGINVYVLCAAAVYRLRVFAGYCIRALGNFRSASAFVRQP